MDITDKQIQRIDTYLTETLSPARYEHSLSTGRTAEKLCRRFGLNADKGYLTGLIHDIAREYDHSRIIDICMEKGEKVSEWEMEEPVLLHGKAGAAVLTDKFGINDREILDAVRLHTTGSAGMSSMAKILFIADYIEPCRKHITGEFINSLENMCIDKMLRTVLESILEYTESCGKKAAVSSIELLEELKI